MTVRSEVFVRVTVRAEIAPEGSVLAIDRGEIVPESDRIVLVDLGIVRLLAVPVVQADPAGPTVRTGIDQAEGADPIGTVPEIVLTGTVPATVLTGIAPGGGTVRAGATALGGEIVRDGTDPVGTDPAGVGGMITGEIAGAGT